MFEVPKRWRPPQRPPKSDSWRKATGKPVSCDICIIDLYNGTPDGQLDHARHRLTQPSGRVWMICDRHASAIKAGERKLPV